jgi:hypothetical protein
MTYCNFSVIASAAKQPRSYVLAQRHTPCVKPRTENIYRGRHVVTAFLLAMTYRNFSVIASAAKQPRSYVLGQRLPRMVRV